MKIGDKVKLVLHKDVEGVITARSSKFGWVYFRVVFDTELPKKLKKLRFTQTMWFGEKDLEKI